MGTFSEVGHRGALTRGGAGAAVVARTSCYALAADPLCWYERRPWWESETRMRRRAREWGLWTPRCGGCRCTGKAVAELLTLDLVRYRPSDRWRVIKIHDASMSNLRSCRTVRNFVHLHSASAFSAHYGVSWPEDLAQAAAADGADALAITDRDGLYGAVKHVKACMAAGIDPMIGVDLAVLEEGHHGLEVAGRVVVLAHGGATRGPGCRLRRPVPPDFRRPCAQPRGLVGLTLAQLATGVLDPLIRQGRLDGSAGPRIPRGQGAERAQVSAAAHQIPGWRNAMPVGSLVVEILSHLSAPGAAMSTSHAVRHAEIGAGV